MGTRIPIDRSDKEQKYLKEKLDYSTSELGLPLRTTNCLDERGICTIRDLLSCKREDLLSIPNFGEKTLEDVLQALEKLGFPRKSREQEKPETTAEPLG